MKQSSHHFSIVLTQPLEVLNSTHQYEKLVKGQSLKGKNKHRSLYTGREGLSLGHKNIGQTHQEYEWKGIDLLNVFVQHFLPKLSQSLFVVKESVKKIFQKGRKYKMIIVNYAPSFQHLGKYLGKQRTMKSKALSGGVYNNPVFLSVIQRQPMWKKLMNQLLKF